MRTATRVMGKTKFARIAVILLLVAMVFAGNPGISHTLAEAAGTPLYVSDVLAFQGATMEDCIRQCEEMGYIPSKKNLNEGAIEKVSFGFDVSSPVVMLGYTTTANSNLAITNISLLHMGEGYEIRDFQSIAAALLAKNQNYAEGLAAAATDFASNYDKGAPAAVAAYKALDLMYVDDLDKHTFGGYVDNLKKLNAQSDLTADVLETARNLMRRVGMDPDYTEYDWSDHEPLSQFVCEGRADAEFFGKLLAFGTPSVVNAVNTALCSGAAEYQNYYNSDTQEYETKVWAERLITDDAKVMIEGGLTTDEWRKFDSSYMDAARDLAKSLQEFTTQYLNAKAHGVTVQDGIASMGEAETAEEAMHIAENMQEGATDFIYVAAFETLNKYRYSDDTLLGDWVVQMGQRTYATAEDYRTLYPLADVISSAQLTMVKYCGFATFVNKMLQPAEKNPALDQAFQKIVEGLRGLTSKNDSGKKNIIDNVADYFSNTNKEYRVSVWIGVDPSVYRGKIAMTSDAIRKSVASDALRLTQAEKDAESAYVRNLLIGIGSGLTDLAAMVVSHVVESKAAALLAAGCTATVASQSAMWAFLAGLSTVLSYIGLITTLITIAKAIITWVYGLIQEELHVPSSDYTHMPTMLYESFDTSKGTRLMKYSAVWLPNDGRVCDTNAYTGSEWNCLYVTYDTDAGSPLVVQEGMDPFTVETDSATPAGYAPVTRFGETSAADLNYGAYEAKDNRRNYLFCTTQKSVARLAAKDSSDQKGTTDNKDGLYIADMVLATADTVERARAKIIEKAGAWNIIDRNLGTKEYPVYLGYTLTNNEKDAITDIRVVARCAEQSYSFGSAPYSCAGTLPSGDGLYFSKSPLVGTAIHSELSFVSHPNEARVGWEPVVYVSGAPVYQFGSGDDSYVMYFEPKEKFTSGETYVGGMAFLTATRPDYSEEFVARDDLWKIATEEQQKQDAVDSMLNLTKWQDSSVASINGSRINMMSGLSYKKQSGGDYYNFDQNMFLMYSFTHNPYRALRDVTLYTTTTKNTSALPSSLAKTILLNKNGVEQNVAGTYVPAEELLSEPTRILLGTETNTTGSHAYMYRGSRQNLKDFYVVAQNDGSNASWKRSELRMRGLYVLGPVEGIDPLKASDVVLSTQPYDATNDDGNICTSLPAGCSALDGSSQDGQMFHSVQDIKYPYNLPAQNLSYPAFEDQEGNSTANNYGEEKTAPSDPLYLYLRGTVRRPKYISSVVVGSYTEEDFKASNPKATKDVVKAMNAVAEDTAWANALRGVNGEVIPTNIASAQGEAWNTKSDGKYGVASTKYEPKTSYIAVNRTDDLNKAVRGFLLVEKSVAEPGAAPITTLQIKGKTAYNLANGSQPVMSNDGPYYLYYSQNSASTPGVPIYDMSIDNNAFVKGKSTVLCANQTGEQAQLYGNANLGNFIHCSYQQKDGIYMNALYVGRGDTLDAALLDALVQGATEAVVADISAEMTGNDRDQYRKDPNNTIDDGATKHMVIGYRTMAVSQEQIALHKRTAGTSSDPLREAIRDVIITVGEPMQESLVHNGVVYKPVSRANLHEGTAAPSLYLYECMDHYTIAYNAKEENTKKLIVPSLQSKFASPITKIGMAQGDRVPYNSGLMGSVKRDGDELLVWENVLSTKGLKTDLNYGIITTDTRKQNVVLRAQAALVKSIIDPARTDPIAYVDNRRYLFVHREDNSVKPGAEITGGFVTDTETVGKLYGFRE